MAAQRKGKPAAMRGARPNETEAEMADRHLSELLQELRIALPGVQVLFAFLLTVPFAARFEDLKGSQQDLYFAVLALAALAIALFIAPSAHHRILFHRHQKTFLVATATRFAIAGLVALALAIVGSLWLISSFLFDATTTKITIVVAATVFGLLWFVEPLIRRLQGPEY